MMLDRFVVREEIGRGGQSVVHAAVETLTGRPVVAKFLRSRWLRDGTAVQRFMREGQLQQRVHSPFVVPVLEVTDVPVPRIIQERVDGPTLAVMLGAQGPMDWRDASRHVCDVLRGLHDIHQAGLVHRDVTPHNCLLDRAGKVWITDFGLALGEAGPRLTETGAELGTAMFVAPEQRLDAHEVGPQADIYSVGVMLYALTTGKTIDLALISSRPAHPAWDRVVKPLATVLQRACQYQPEDRYDSALAMLNELSLAMRQRTASPLPQFRRARPR